VAYVEIVKAGAKAVGAIVAAKIGERLLESSLNGGSEKVKDKADERRCRKMALDLARDIGGQYSERTVVGEEYRYIVWKDGKPVQAFPTVEGASTAQELAERAELRDFQGNLKDPPATSAE
jgi:hypothetical protein